MMPAFSTQRANVNRCMPHVRRGMSLIEVLVAVILLSIVLTSLTALTFSVARQGRTISGTTYRSGAVAEETNRLMVLPYDSLPNAAGCATVTTSAYPYTRCVTLATLSPNVKGVRLIVSVLTSPAPPPDTVRFTRSTLPKYNPFNTP
jgi:prepilin-type N-terminal cleavage/methylation domain-containing protein